MSRSGTKKKIDFASIEEMSWEQFIGWLTGHALLQIGTGVAFKHVVWEISNYTMRWSASQKGNRT